jgi:hypothetical protein
MLKLKYLLLFVVCTYSSCGDAYTEYASQAQASAAPTETFNHALHLRQPKFSPVTLDYKAALYYPVLEQKLWMPRIAFLEKLITVGINDSEYPTKMRRSAFNAVLLFQAHAQDKLGLISGIIGIKSRSTAVIGTGIGIAFLYLIASSLKKAAIVFGIGAATVLIYRQRQILRTLHYLERYNPYLRTSVIPPYEELAVKQEGIFTKGWNFVKGKIPQLNWQNSSAGRAL